ncbi:hypothetical protein EXU85_04670 [Spirosoma sp. KCTC 42546]|uniref:hypothetical protein n=1 Tax=Spirosoma sp. KCTC 42546 TaxID=2520506 RepID=UPI00115C0C26|nr:hypothetical protein [Spirosoma sp. KCTC 42546]QDK77919.1 hypothetical protein EXU85_04670 [Spirosoma sp. KCTC 42546]
MKTLVTAFLALSASVAMAQHGTSISRNINDDGKTLSIRVKGTVDDKPIDYDRTFDVSNLNKDERDALREHILDSLNVSMPAPPRPPRAPRAALAPHAPMPPRAPIAPRAPRSPESIAIISSDQETVSLTNGDNQTMAVGGKHPYTKEVKYDSDAGQLYLRYKFQKDGDDVTYERTIDVQNKSQQERQRLIEDIEKSIGVPKAGK